MCSKNSPRAPYSSTGNRGKVVMPPARSVTSFLVCPRVADGPSQGFVCLAFPIRSAGNTSALTHIYLTPFVIKEDIFRECSIHRSINLNCLLELKKCLSTWKRDNDLYFRKIDILYVIYLYHHIFYLYHLDRKRR